MDYNQNHSPCDSSRYLYSKSFIEALMTYEEAQDAIVTNTEAAREIRKHGHNPVDFFLEYGYKNEYQAADVLAWLGY